MTLNRLKRPDEKARLKTIFIRLRAIIGSILFLGLLSAAGALLLFAWLAEAVLEDDTHAFDETVRTFINGFASESMTALMNFVTILGSTLFLSIAFVCILIIFIRIGWKRSTVLFITTMVGVVILNFVLKVSFARTRPIPFFDTPLPNSYSFPSGHALFAACFYGVLAWLIAGKIRKRWLKNLIWVISISLILLTGLSRIYLGVHYPSDVIASYAAATVWVLTIMFMDLLVRTKTRFIKKHDLNNKSNNRSL